MIDWQLYAGLMWALSGAPFLRLASGQAKPDDARHSAKAGVVREAPSGVGAGIAAKTGSYPASAHTNILPFRRR